LQEANTRLSGIAPFPCCFRDRTKLCTCVWGLPSKTVVEDRHMVREEQSKLQKAGLPPYPEQELCPQIPQRTLIQKAFCLLRELSLSIPMIGRRTKAQ
jgi:hypothetical protein